MNTSDFTKVLCGQACRLATLTDAEWARPELGASWEQATDPYGCVVAYQDNTGWWILTTLADKIAEHKPANIPANLLADIAREHLLIETLETRNSDSLDFHETAVWCVRDALAAAYDAGRKAQMKKG